MKKQIFIFDLDDTVIDSSHRATLKSDCIELDLDAWRRDSTRENIFKDKLLPLARFMKECIEAEHTFVWVCTARNMQQADHDFLAHHGLTPNLVLSRQLDDDTADHILKKKMIGKLLNLKPFKDCETIFFDDKPKNLQALENLIDFNLNARAINDIGAIPVEWATA
jgi:FMN phosphatase YigB (HAD superfamily)